MHEIAPGYTYLSVSIGGLKTCPTDLQWVVCMCWLFCCACRIQRKSKHNLQKDYQSISTLSTLYSLCEGPCHLTSSVYSSSRLSCAFLHFSMHESLSKLANSSHSLRPSPYVALELRLTVARHARMSVS